MSLFEYITVASSIILSLAVVRLLDTIPHAFRAPRRYTVHCALVVCAIWGCAQFWWVAWSLGGAVHWTYPKFLLYLSAPALLYSLARTLSSPDPDEVESFRDYFNDVHKRFFGLLSSYLVILFLISWLLHEVPLVHPLRMFQLTQLIAAASGIFVGRPRYHAALAVLFLIGYGISTFMIFWEPGGGLSSNP